MAKTVGELIKEARTGAGLSQEKLANMIDGLSAGDISKAERGEKELSQSVLKQIAKATGVTQASLVNAAKEAAEGKKPAASAKKTTSSAKTASASKTSSANKTAAKDEMQLTAAEKKLVELYRAADSDTKKAAVSLLKGETPSTEDVIGNLIGSAVNMFSNFKK